jgi:hypothetical protein
VQPRRKLNPMFGKTQCLAPLLKYGSRAGGQRAGENTKNLISISRSIKPLGLYDENNNLIDKYSNQVKLASKFNVNKSTISRCIK